MDIKLVMFKPDGQRKDIPLTAATTVIGRGEDCELRVPVLAVSRHHCQLTITGDDLEARDLGSSNGTYVNNERVDEVGLDAGDRLTIGPVVFTVQIDGVPEQIAPTVPADDAQSEEIIDLEADLADDADSDAFADLESTQDDDELDPIAALEALAAEKDDKKEDE